MLLAYGRQIAVSALEMRLPTVYGYREHVVAGVGRNSEFDSLLVEWSHGAFMGGHGSGWQGAKKATVEDALSSIAASLVRKRALVAGAWTSGSWGWTYDGEDKPHATIGYEADLWDQDNAWLRLHYHGTASRWTTGSGS